MEGSAQMTQQMGISWMVLEGLLYTTGALLYAVSDISTHNRNSVLIYQVSNTGTLQSWHVRHMGKFTSDIPYIDPFRCRIASQGTSQCF
jgi:predicted membrane channel-forming protein YqfA (hemolysin III family)